MIYLRYVRSLNLQSDNRFPSVFQLFAMSADCNLSDPKTNKATSASPSVSAGKRSYSEYLGDINHKFKNLTDDVLPTAPYLLTIPTDRPFQVGSRFVNNWAVGENKLFGPEEENLQYMTFLAHQTEDTLLVAVGGWSDEKGNIMDEEGPSNMSSISTLNRNAQQDVKGLKKKKISLSDYKKKALETPAPRPKSTAAPSVPSNGANGTSRTSSGAKGSTTTPQVKLEHNKQEGKDRRQTVKPESPSINRNSSHKTRDERPSSPAAPRSDNMRDRSSSRPQHRQDPSLKKPRLSVHEERESEHSIKTKRSISTVPELLSPTLPSDSIGPNIPPLLSPTLPPDIEEELKLQDEPSRKLPISTHKKSNPSQPADSKAPSSCSTNRSHSGSVSSPNPPKLNRPKGPSHATPKINPDTRSLADGKSHRQQDQQVGEKRPAQTTQALKTPAVQSPPDLKMPRAHPPAKSTLIVKLKYGRQNRKRIEALLKISKRKPAAVKVSGKPKPLLDDLIAPRETESAKSSLFPPSKVPGKRPGLQAGDKRLNQSDNEDIHEPALKRPRSNSRATEPSQTPSLPPSRATSVKHPPSATYDQFLTPTRELKAPAMGRVGSGDSGTRTPTGRLPSADRATSRDPERRLWREEYQRLVALGRELKHTSQRSTRKNSKLTPADEKLGATIAVEAILCFILAFTIDDKRHAINRTVGDSAGWRSILPYWQAVGIQTKRYPDLHGLLLILGAVSHEAIHSIDIERVAVSALPGENSPAPTPGSDGNTVTSEESKKQRREFIELKNRLPESYKDAHRLWLEGSCHLPDSVISTGYPTTWAKRAVNLEDRQRKDQFKPGEYEGDFFLPLGLATSPIDMVRFGHSFLQEWIEKNEIEWKPRLTL